jgi:gamma-glutamylcyclotransferase (GGCT)/AIG2-like uncharacterized protein YtfP
MKIFAYGTLKKGGVLHKHMKGAKFIKTRKIHGYSLYLAPDETYPLLYYTGDKQDVVVGELWQINEKLKAKLDKYEEGYVLKKLLKSPIMTYYPNYDIKHLSRVIPKNKHGKYEFDVREHYYLGYNITGVISYQDPSEDKKRSTKDSPDGKEKKAKKPRAAKGALLASVKRTASNEVLCIVSRDKDPADKPKRNANSH